YASPYPRSPQSTGRAPCSRTPSAGFLSFHSTCLYFRLCFLRRQSILISLPVAPALVLLLLDHFRDRAGSHRPPAFAYRKSQPLLHRDRRDQLHSQVRVVSGHHHLHSLRQRRHSSHVRRPKVKLRPIPTEKRRVPSPFFLRQHVHLCLEFRVRRDRS